MLEPKRSEIVPSIRGRWLSIHLLPGSPRLEKGSACFTHVHIPRKMRVASLLSSPELDIEDESGKREVGEANPGPFILMCQPSRFKGGTTKIRNVCRPVFIDVNVPGTCRERSRQLRIRGIAGERLRDASLGVGMRCIALHNSALRVTQEIDSQLHTMSCDGPCRGSGSTSITGCGVCGSLSTHGFLYKCTLSLNSDGTFVQTN